MNKVYCQICAARQNKLMKSWSKLFVFFFSCNVLLIICNHLWKCETWFWEYILKRNQHSYQKVYRHSTTTWSPGVPLTKLLGGLLFYGKEQVRFIWILAGLTSKGYHNTDDSTTQLAFYTEWKNRLTILSQLFWKSSVFFLHQSFIFWIISMGLMDRKTI